MDCKTALILGLFYAVGCEGETAQPGVEAAPPVAHEQTVAPSNKRSGRSTGLTLQDLVADMKWRKKTFERMARNAGQSDPAGN